MRKIKLKHLGFVMGAVLLVTGWLIRLTGVFVAFSNAGYQLLDELGGFLSASGCIFLLGGIVFYGIISAKEAGNPLQKPITEVEHHEKETDELGETAEKIKNSIPFTAFYGAISVLLTLLVISSMLSVKNFKWLGFLLVGLFLSQYYIRKSMGQFRWISSYKKERFEKLNVVKIIEEYYIDASEEAVIVLRVFDNETAFVLFDEYPLDDTETEKLVDEFSQFIGAKVFRDDRERFVILSMENHVIRMAISFLKVKTKEWEANR